MLLVLLATGILALMWIGMYAMKKASDYFEEEVEQIKK